MRITKINLKLRLLKVEIQWKCEVQTLKLEITTEISKLCYLRLPKLKTTLIPFLPCSLSSLYTIPESVGPTEQIPPIRIPLGPPMPSLHVWRETLFYANWGLRCNRLGVGVM